MFLKSIRLKNVRCFDDLELDLTDPDGGNRKWTILVGENGTGKSTILRASALITCGSDALTELLGNPDDWIRIGADTCSIEAVLETKSHEKRELGIEIRRGDSISDVIARCRSTLAPLDDAIENAQRNYFVAAYGSSRRLSSRTSMSFHGDTYGHIRARSVATLFNSDIALNPLESWAMDVDYRNPGEGMQTVRSVLAGFLPGLSFVEIDKKNRNLLFKTPDGIVPLYQLSDGYQNVAAWIGDLLYRITNIFEDYRSPLKVRGVLIIDEVDLHLHPIWQRALHDFLDRKLPNLQMLVTTHSPLTVQQAAVDQVYYLKRHGKNVSLYPFSANPKQMLISQILVSEVFGVTTDESLSIEKKKSRYRELREQKGLSDGKLEELEKLRSVLSQSVQSSVTNTDLRTEQAELIRQIGEELKNKKS